MESENSKYKNSKIYIITNTKNSKTYIGATMQPLCRRMTTHRQQAKLKAGTNTKSKLYLEMNNVGIQEFRISLLETYECNNIEELHKKELECITKHKPELNINAPYTELTEKERRQSYMQKYYNNRDQVLARCQKYKNNNKEKIKEYHHNRWLRRKKAR